MAAWTPIEPLLQYLCPIFNHRFWVYCRTACLLPTVSKLFDCKTRLVDPVKLHGLNNPSTCLAAMATILLKKARHDSQGKLKSHSHSLAHCTEALTVALTLAPTSLNNALVRSIHQLNYRIEIYTRVCIYSG